MWDALHHWANEILIWVGFGTIVGLAAKAIFPGRDPGGPLATILMGGGGTAVGAGMLALIWGERVTPLSMLGFVSAVLGAIILLIFHHLLAGRFFKEVGTGTGRRYLFPRRRKRVTVVTTND